MAGKNVKATEVKPGDVIEIRGTRAMVFKVWSKFEDSPVRPFPVGIEIGWVDPSNGQANSTRLVWPDLDLAQKSLTGDEIVALLPADLKKRPVKRLYAWG